MQSLSDIYTILWLNFSILIALGQNYYPDFGCRSTLKSSLSHGGSVQQVDVFQIIPKP